MRKAVALTLSLAMLVGLTACGSKPADTKSGDTQPAASKPAAAGAPAQSPFPPEIEVGVITSRTGGEAKFGEAQLRGYEIALEEINKAGGILGSKLKLVIEDDASKPENAITAVEKLATQLKLPIILGAYSSAATLPAAQTATKYQVPFVVPTAAADNITQFGSKYVFRINSPSSQYASTAINFLKEAVKPQTIAIVYENTNFGTSTANPTKKFAEEAGMKVVAFESYAKGAPDFKPMLAKIKQANPDVIFFVSYLLDATLLMRQVRELDINPRVYIGAGAGFSASEFTREQGAGKNAEYTFSATLWTPDVTWKGAKEFAAEFQKRHNVMPEYHAAETHATLYLLKNVLERTKSLDREKIRAALAETNLGDNDTIFGPVKFDDKGQNAHPMVVTQVQNGQYVTVWPAAAASSKPAIPAPAWKDRK